MSEQNEKPDIFHNATFVLAAIFIIPALLVIGATWVTASYGRVPGGTTTTCERTFGDTTVKVEMYRYLAGLTPYETQTFFTRENDATWREFYRVDIQVPRDFDCDTGMRQLDANTILIATQKGIAISHDNGETWRTHSVCNAPRPVGGRCDIDERNIGDVSFANAQQGRLTVQEVVVDEYGVVVNDENGQPRIGNEYILVTDDGGLTWNLAND
jgi:hypothetical protein